MKPQNQTQVAKTLGQLSAVKPVCNDLSDDAGVMIIEPAKPPLVTPPAAADAPAVLTPEKTPAGIADFGEKIHGARKDTWHQYADTLAAGLPADFAQITLAKHFPVPDYAGAIERGADADNLAMLAALRDLIPAKPRKSYKLARWGELVTLAHGLAQRIADTDFKLDAARLNEIIAQTGEKISGKIKLYRRLGFPLFTRADGWEIKSADLGHGTPDGLKWERTTYATQNGRWIKEAQCQTADDAAGWESVFDVIKTKISAEIGSHEAAREIKFNIYSDRRTADVFIGKKGLRDVIRLKTGFKSASEARVYLTANRADLEKQWQALAAKPQLRKAANAPRIGQPWRTDGPAGDVTPEKFSAAFGFRGVQFGNYVESGRRKADLNESHDALLDLASALGLAPAAVSLAGGLGMAFGARGRGGDALAHFEPLQCVINITKTRGPGSLAHEWFHALDNFLARYNETGRTDTRADGYGTNGLKTLALSADIVAALAELKRVLSRGDFSRRADFLDCTRAKPYWGTTIEKAARAFEIYIAAKLGAAGVFNDYLVNLLDSKGGGAYPTPDEMADGIATAFDTLFNHLKNSPFFNA